MAYTAIDLFAGCGGMTEGMFQAGFDVVAAIELDINAAAAYRANNESRNVVLFENDIRLVNPDEIQNILGHRQLHLLAGCPPCQGFSQMRRRNKKGAVRDARNKLIWEYVRFVEALRPYTIILENVPALINYTDFKKAASKLKSLGYHINYEVVNVANYGVPQRRKRLVLVGSLFDKLLLSPGNGNLVTVRDIIGNLENVNETDDVLHTIFPHHSPEVQRRIQLTPPDGGSRMDLPEEFTLECHRNPAIGYKDVYGRLRWDSVSSTITGGCLNPSKGRFLHPEENRCISAREAAMLQTFPRCYIFPNNLSHASIALMIGNALPPEFCRQQATQIAQHLSDYFMADIFDKEKRSSIMRSVKNKGTSPELFIRGLLCELGYKHYRLSCPSIHCKPDIVYPGKKKAIFINGCFWHGHDCKRGALPATNTESWREKAEKNKKRERENLESLDELGWDSLIIWQCEIKQKNISNLKIKLKEFLQTT